MIGPIIFRDVNVIVTIIVIFVVVVDGPPKKAVSRGGFLLQDERPRALLDVSSLGLGIGGAEVGEISHEAGLAKVRKDAAECVRGPRQSRASRPELEDGENGEHERHDCDAGPEREQVRAVHLVAAEGHAGKGNDQDFGEQRGEGQQARKKLPSPQRREQRRDRMQSARHKNAFPGRSMAPGELSERLEDASRCSWTSGKHDVATRLKQQYSDKGSK